MYHADTANYRLLLADYNNCLMSERFADYVHTNIAKNIDRQ